jgi:DNA-binding CsgD family transcriptional regulator
MARSDAPLAPDGNVPNLRLTPREQETLDLLAEGLVLKDIAAELGVTVETVRGYVKSLQVKLGAHTQLQAVLAAARCGLLRKGHPLT